jgi:hypothetical protein
VFAATLFAVSCGSVSGKSTDGGTGGVLGGSGGAGGAGGKAGGTGGTGGAANCNAVTQACGGDIVGTWKVTQTCLSASKDLTSVCAGASATFDYTFNGTVTYNADKTYSSSITGSAVVHEHYPAGCMPFGYTCTQLDQTAMDAGTGSCSTDATGTCNCDGVATATPSTVTGTYTASGGTLTTMHDGTTSLASYCVQGAYLYQSAEPAADAGTTAVGIVVLAKQ